VLRSHSLRRLVGYWTGDLSKRHRLCGLVRDEYVKRNREVVYSYERAIEAGEEAMDETLAELPFCPRDNS
jgi:hypothetical protein